MHEHVGLGDLAFIAHVDWIKRRITHAVETHFSSSSIFDWLGQCAVGYAIFDLSRDSCHMQNSFILGIGAILLYISCFEWMKKWRNSPWHGHFTAEWTKVINFDKTNIYSNSEAKPNCDPLNDRQEFHSPRQLLHMTGFNLMHLSPWSNFRFITWPVRCTREQIRLLRVSVIYIIHSVVMCFCWTFPGANSFAIPLISAHAFGDMLELFHMHHHNLHRIHSFFVSSIIHQHIFSSLSCDSIRLYNFPWLHSI